VIYQREKEMETERKAFAGAKKSLDNGSEKLLAAVLGQTL
jgi:hypothetical protein